MYDGVIHGVLVSRFAVSWFRGLVTSDNDVLFFGAWQVRIETEESCKQHMGCLISENQLFPPHFS